VCDINWHCNRGIADTFVFKYSVLEHRFLKVMMMMMMIMMMMMMMMIIIIIIIIPLETKSSRSAHWQLVRSAHYPLIMTLDVIGFKGFRMHFCGRGGFRFPLLSYLEINVVHLVHSVCRPSCLLLHSAGSVDLSSHAGCLQCETLRHNLHSAPSYLLSLFFLKIMFSLNLYRSSSFFSFEFASFSFISSARLYSSCIL
jgi:hypothetical protein